jgi:hypothetical protein
MLRMRFFAACLVLQSLTAFVLLVAQRQWGAAKALCVSQHVELSCRNLSVLLASVAVAACRWCAAVQRPLLQPLLCILLQILRRRKALSDWRFTLHGCSL